MQRKKKLLLLLLLMVPKDRPFWLLLDAAFCSFSSMQPLPMLLLLEWEGQQGLVLRVFRRLGEEEELGLARQQEGKHPLMRGVEMPSY